MSETKNSIKAIKPLGSLKVGIEKNPVYGRNKFAGCGHTIRPAMGNNQEYVTGLEVMVPNPDFKSQEDTPTEQAEILLRTLLEKKLNLKDLSPHSIFWEDFRIKLNEEGKVFNINDYYELMQYQVAAADYKVAYADTREAAIQKPSAEYYTVDEEREANEKSKIRKIRRQADDIIRNATIQTKRKYANLLGGATFAHAGVPENLVDEFLERFVLQEPMTLINLAGKPDTYIATKDEALKAEDCGVIKKSEGRYYIALPDGDLGQELGVDIDTVAKFLAAPKNQEIRFELKDRVASRKQNIE